MSEYFKPLPKPTPTSRPFWEAAKASRTEDPEMRRVQPVHLLSARSMPELFLRSSSHGSASADAAKLYSYTVVWRASTAIICRRAVRARDRRTRRGSADDDQHRRAAGSGSKSRCR